MTGITLIHEHCCSYPYQKVKDPDASIRGIKLAAMQESGYYTLAAVAK